MAKQKETGGLGSNAFFQEKSASKSQTVEVEDEKPERYAFNLKPSVRRLLEEVQIKTMREGDKWTLSAIVERGIELVAKEMDVSE